jgi:hypothetical protein
MTPVAPMPPTDAQNRSASATLARPLGVGSRNVPLPSTNRRPTQRQIAAAGRNGKQKPAGMLTRRI